MPVLIDELAEAAPEVADYSDYLSTLTERADEITTLIGGIQGFLIFGAVVVLAWLTYKFFRMFF